jgi:signal transduction histidine kinase
LNPAPTQRPRLPEPASRRAGRGFRETLLEALPQGVCAYHAGTGQCVVANERALAITGLTLDQALAQNFRNLPTWRRDGFLAAAERVLATGVAEAMESLGPASSGKPAQVRAQFSRFRSRGEWHLLLLLSDIQERSRAEQENLRSMKAILDAAPEAACLLSAEGGLIAANEKLATLLAVFRRVEADLEIQRDLHSTLRESNEALLRGGDRETLCRGVCEAAVRSGRFNLAWVGVPDGHGQVAIFASAGPAQAFLDRVGNAPDGTVPAWQAASIAGSRVSWTCVDNDLSADGLAFSVAMPLREAGRCMGALHLHATEPAFFTDERMALLENLAANLSHAMDLRGAEDLQRNLEGLKAKSQIAAYIAHEINNPLAGIKQSFQVIAGAIPADHPDRPFVAIIARELDRIAGIVRMAYSIHRPGLPQVRDCLVGETLADLASLLVSKLRPRHLALELPELDRGLRGRLHEDILRQILFNVLQNAIEASPERGRIRCRCGRDGRDLVVEVEDQGPGVAPEIAAHLFESGFTTKSAQETGGLGMGLATCRSILQSVGGSIGFRNLAPGPGACFFLRLPWQDESTRGDHE